MKCLGKNVGLGLLGLVGLTEFVVVEGPCRASRFWWVLMRLGTVIAILGFIGLKSC